MSSNTPAKVEADFQVTNQPSYKFGKAWPSSACPLLFATTSFNAISRVRLASNHQPSETSISTARLCRGRDVWGLNCKVGRKSAP